MEGEETTSLPRALSETSSEGSPLLDKLKIHKLSRYTNNGQEQLRLVDGTGRKVTVGIFML